MSLGPGRPYNKTYGLAHRPWGGFPQTHQASGTREGENKRREGEGEGGKTEGGNMTRGP